MTWEQRKDQQYYYRRRRVNGRVEAEYLGRGAVAELAACLDELEREYARLRAHQLKELRKSDTRLDREVQAATKNLQLLTSILLEAEGLHQPKGTWRHRR